MGYSRPTVIYRTNVFRFNSYITERYSDWLRAGRPRSRSSSPGIVKNFLFSTSFGPGRQADHSPSASVEVKKMWIYTSTTPYAFMA
jgi:hypothetical protein